MYKIIKTQVSINKQAFEEIGFDAIDMAKRQAANQIVKLIFDEGYIEQKTIPQRNHIMFEFSLVLGSDLNELHSSDTNISFNNKMS